ncbi:acyltransferase [Mucilaginibacter sp. JRF]|uniref:acyltransferase family protein n=1 Tax=Mucilaginibacter sp. JRF TaxID=2780088 RepID=UPI00187EB21A|nr:acyltransferase [Mucilaginibacter sp. JRF]MBE9585162.1 acyltransferase [Mucilaginibacter sp. JRF]
MSAKKINSVQLLRVIAVSLVIFLHAGLSGSEKLSVENSLASFYHLSTWGAIGVDLFFSISGFIMTIVVPSYSQRSDWKKFFGRRLIRILPLYYLLTILTALNMIFVHHQSVTILSALKSILFFPFFDDYKFVDPIVGVGWSLSYEIYFYTLISIFLVFGKNIYKSLFIAISLLVIVGLTFNIQSPLLKFLTSPILLEFAFGMICGLIYKRVNKLTHIGNDLKILVVLSIVIGLTLMSITIFVTPNFDLHSMHELENNNGHAFYRAIVWGVPSAIFMLGIILFERVFHQRIVNVLVLAGDASYSCYLIHAQLYAIQAYLFKYLHLGIEFYLISVIPFCVILSIVFYRLVERTLILLFDKWFNTPKQVIMT